MSGSADYFENTVGSVALSVSTAATPPPHDELSTSWPSLIDIVRDLQTEDPAITVASLTFPPATVKHDDFNFTKFTADGADASSMLMPLHSLWTLFPLVFMTTFLIGWLFRLKFWYYYYRLLMALGLQESELIKSAGGERVPTELASARLVRATKSELDLTAVSEVNEVCILNFAPNGDVDRKAEHDIVSVRL